MLESTRTKTYGNIFCSSSAWHILARVFLRKWNVARQSVIPVILAHVNELNTKNMCFTSNYTANVKSKKKNVIGSFLNATLGDVQLKISVSVDVMGSVVFKVKISSRYAALQFITWTRLWTKKQRFTYVVKFENQYNNKFK